MQDISCHVNGMGVFNRPFYREIFCVYIRYVF